MKPPRFDYVRTDSVREAVDALVGGDGDGKLLAGGQSLVPMLNFRLARPSLLVDVARLQELQRLERDGDVLVVGAGVRQHVAETSPVVRDGCALMIQALRNVGHIQIRTRGTIGGSLAHADPAAELPAVAVALDVELVAEGPDGRRAIPASEFFVGPYMTALAEDEVLVEARFPVLPGARTAFVELARRSGDFALAGIACAVVFDGEIVRQVRLAAAGAAVAPVRLSDAEASLRGNPVNPGAIAEAAKAASVEVSPTGADASYRRELVGVLVGRALASVRRAQTMETSR